MIEKLTDNDPMPFGKYQGQKMANVPANYLLYLWEQNQFRYMNGKRVKDYIERNLEAIKKEQADNLRNGKK